MIIKLTTTPTAELWSEIYQQADAYGNDTLAVLWDGQLEVVYLNGSVDAGIAGVASNPFVAYAEPNYLRQIAAVPDDTSFLDLWGLRNIGQVVGGVAGTDGADIEATSAWEVSTGSTEVIVGVVDTGVDYRHPDLAGNMWVDPRPGPSFGSHGFNAITGTFDPLDDHSHGTHVAGTIGATGNNGLGVVGVNWTTRIMALKFLSASGSGTTADAITAINYAVQAKLDGVNVRVLSNSWGGGGFSQALRDMISTANDNGILFVAAAGNATSDNDVTPFYPSSYEVANVISVAATNNVDGIASFSNFGLSSVDLGAPGRNILSTVLNGQYDFKSGTSMATPHVSGAAALILATQPTLSVSQLISALLDAVDPIPALTGKVLTGGRLNVCRSVSGPGCGAPPPPDPVPPTVSITSPADGAVVRGSTTITADAADDVGILFVRFLADGVFVGADAAAPYSVTWDTTTVANGTHVLTAEAVDVGRNTTVSAPITVTVADPPSYAVTEVPFAYRSFTGTGLGLTYPTTATIFSPFPIPFGDGALEATQLIVSGHGYLSFTTDRDDHNNWTLPSPLFTNLVAPFWDDLIPATPFNGGTLGAGDVFWTVLGSAPNRELVVEWRDIPHDAASMTCGSSGPVCNGATFQVVFFEGSSDILFNYLDVDFADVRWDNGSDATVGIQISPNVATTFSFRTPSLRDNMSLLWRMQIPPPSNTPPSVSIASPTDGASFAQGDTVLFSGSASDVEDGDLSASISWSSSVDGFLGTGASFSLATLSAGSHLILAEAVDSGGAQGSASATISVVAANQPPIAGFDATANGLSVSFVDTSTDDGVIVTWLWDFGDGTTSSLANPTHTYGAAGTFLVTLGVTDDAGAGDSISQSITVVNDTTPPTVSVSNPAGGTTVSGTVTINATASDNVGVSRVDFFVDGGLLISDTTSPYSATWDTTTVADGSRALSARAFDAAGNVGNSATVNVMVQNAAPPPPPTTTTTFSGSLDEGATRTHNLTIEGTGQGDSTLTYARSRANPVLTVFDPNNNPVATGGGASPIQVSFTATIPGVYRFEIKNQSNRRDTDYTLQITHPTGGAPPPPPTITSTPATDAMVGQSYTYQATASGDPPITWSLVTPPAGMTIGATTGLVNWTPTAPGSVAVQVQASNAVGSDTQAFTITVSELPTITSAPVTAGTVGQAYSYQASASGTQPITWELLNGPTGMTINATGLVSWTPSTAGSFGVEIRASNLAGSDTQTYTIAVAGPPVISSSPITEGTVGQAYSYQAVASGTEPITWALPTAPAGMIIDVNTGLVNWTPSASGNFPVTIQASNAVGSDTQAFTITVSELPAITSAPVTSGTVGQAYTYQASASGTQPITWTLVNGPTGMTINATGLVSWTPGTAGSFNVEIRATNIAGSATQAYTIAVAGPPVITSSPITEGTVGQAYSYQAVASGTEPITWALPTAPAGMTIDVNTGLVTWTPSASGNFPVTIQASNAVGSDTQAFTLTVVALTPPTITSAPVTSGTVGQAYTYQASASGTQPITWTLVNGPAGMTINATGLVSWTPSAGGSFGVQIQATNVAGSDTQAFTVSVTALPPTVDSFSAAPNPMVEGGTSMLTWTTTGADTVSIDNGVGVGLPDGSVPVSPAATTIYTLTASGPGGTASAPLTLTVNPPPAEPTLDMSISAPGSTSRGDRFTVTATVSHLGGGVASGYSVRLDWSPSGSARLESTRTQSLPPDFAAGSVDRSWRMRADRDGTLNLTVTLRDSLNNVVLTRNASLTIND